MNAQINMSSGASKNKEITLSHEHMMERTGLDMECGLILRGIRAEGQPALEDGAQCGVTLFVVSIELAQPGRVCSCVG